MSAYKHIRLIVFLLVLPMMLGIAALLQAQVPSTTTTTSSPSTPAIDPGVRGGPAGGGGPGWVSGPLRNSVRATIAPHVRIAADHQKAVV